MNEKKNKIKQKCDVCGYRDGFKKLTLMKCQSCDVRVHKECYGFQRQDIDDFVCFPCQAIGKEFQTDAYNEDGIRIKLTQDKRPDQCELCCEKGGNHAMHPLYDSHGTKGRQIMRADPHPRLAWVHTLCAYFIAQKQGMVYGCCRDGCYDGDDDDDDDDEDDDRSENSLLVVDEDDENVDLVSVHHFAYCLAKEGQPENQWTKAIKDHQKELKCYICGQSDRQEGVLRIPLQCSANNEAEFEEFYRMHKEMGGGDQCTSAIHVGCARWGNNSHLNKRVFFFPGAEGIHEAYEDPALEVYCDAHAKDIKNYQQRKKRNKPGINSSERRGSTSRGNDANPPNPVRRQSSASQINDSNRHKKSHISEPIAPKVAPPIKRKAYDFVVLPAQNRGKKRHHRQINQSHTPNVTTNRLLSSKPTKKRNHDNLDKNDAISVTDMERPLLKQRRSSLAATDSRKSMTRLERKFEQIRKELFPQLLAITGPNEDSIREKRRELMVGKKKQCKRELSELSGAEFKRLWTKEIKEPAVEMIVNKSSHDDEDVIPTNRRSKSSKPIVLHEEDDGEFQATFVDITGDSNEQDNDQDLDNISRQHLWSRLCVGPDYKGKPFEFGEWDKVEIL